MKLFIRNMACESCKVLVKEELEKLGAGTVKVELGEAELSKPLSAAKEKKFKQAIGKAGLEVVDSKEGVLVDQIKAAILLYVNGLEKSKSTLSNFLAKKLNRDYSSISAYFSTMSAGTIEQYMISLRIEKAKELLVVEGLTLSEIAHKLNYSSVAHLSAQFKKSTGLPASHFKKLNERRRLSIQEL
jgi:YesN/AraC family two-component response regulator